MHICPVCAGAAVSSAPFIVMFYRRIKSWFKARRDEMKTFSSKSG